VAVKVLKENAEVEEFKKEFFIISSIHSPYVVKFYGASVHPQLAMVMEFCSRGSLYDVMLDEKLAFDWNLALRFAQQTAKAIQCLHHWNPPILHRDLKSLNLLVTEKLEVKLADFGLSRFQTDSNVETLMKVVGTVAYAAPEVFVGTGGYTDKCDVYSVGMVTWELLARTLTAKYQRPYSEYKHLSFDFQIIPRVCGENLRPTLAAEVPEVLSSFIRDSWNPEDVKRPNSDEMVARLEAVSADFEQNQSKWNALLPAAVQTLLVNNNGKELHPVCAQSEEVLELNEARPAAPEKTEPVVRGRKFTQAHPAAPDATNAGSKDSKTSDKDSKSQFVVGSHRMSLNVY